MSVLPEGAEALRESAHAVAQQSYARCLQEPDFFASLYALLLASDPAIPPMFERTAFYPACTDETAAAWRAIVRPGIEFMQSRYQA